MEVLSFFSSNENLKNEFNNFLSSYNKLKLNSECDDTKYYINPNTGRNEIYFHFIFNDVKHEFTRDYTIKEREYINNYFINNNFYFFDIQFKDEIFLKNMLKDLKTFLINRNMCQQVGQILLRHPLNGFINW